MMSGLWHFETCLRTEICLILLILVIRVRPWSLLPSVSVAEVSKWKTSNGETGLQGAYCGEEQTQDSSWVKFLAEMFFLVKQGLDTVFKPSTTGAFALVY